MVASSSVKIHSGANYLQLNFAEFPLEVVVPPEIGRAHV